MKTKEFYELSVPLVLDGGIATELEKTHGKDLSATNLWSSSCLYQDPEAIQQVHLSYFRAGADIATTCSYQTPIESFIKAGFRYQESIELIQKSVHIAVKAKEIYLKENNKINGIKPMISLSFGPYGAILSNGSEYRGDYGKEIDFEKLKNFHKEKLNIFKPLLVEIDFIIFETIPSYLEAESICSLLKEEELDIPCLISFSCKNDEMISDGELFINCVKLCSKVDCIVSIGINCVIPEYVENLIKIARDELIKIGQEKKYILCYPNGAKWDDEKKCWNDGILLKEFENYVKIWLKASDFKIILGGCCKTTPEHIRCIRNIIDEGVSIRSSGMLADTW